MGKKKPKASFDIEDAEKFLLEKGDGWKKVKNRVDTIGALRLPKGTAEAKECNYILNILTDYAKRKKPPRPFSIAVFGPPGSGKSFMVNQIIKKAKAGGKRLDLDLSQVDGQKELTKSLAKFFPRKPDKQTRCLFIDEFDSDELTWLSFFLAPMQSGTFLDENARPRKTGSAIFVFAGGTAEHVDSFAERHKEYFRTRKAPDFLSRLRGVLNVDGINTDDEQLLRRTLVFQHQLGQREKRLRRMDKNGKDTGIRNVKGNVLKRFLATPHYKHGARSMEAVLDMSLLTGAREFTKYHLPSPKSVLLRHVSRGALEGCTVGISADDKNLSETLFSGLAKQLLAQGANLTYGGQLQNKGPLKAILKALKKTECGLLKPKSAVRLRCYHAMPSFYDPNYDPSIMRNQSIVVERLDTLQKREFETLEIEPKTWFVVEKRKKSGKIDRKSYNIRHHLAWSVSLFRMRLRMIRDIDALVVGGGKDGLDEKSWGRFSGVAEEVMLALAFDKPVYILGMSGGAARSLGQLLGLAKREYGVPACLIEPRDADYAQFKRRLQEWEGCFGVAYRKGLPLTYAELREFIVERSQQVDNGLSSKEQRKLFNYKSKDTDKCVKLITDGILKRMKTTNRD